MKRKTQLRKLQKSEWITNPNNECTIISNKIPAAVWPPPQMGGYLMTPKTTILATEK